MRIRIYQAGRSASPPDQALAMSSSPPPCSKAAAAVAAAPASKYCLCAPTTHPGSFRCRLHRSPADAKGAAAAAGTTPPGTEDQEAQDSTAAVVARELLERVARKPRRRFVTGTLRPGPSRLGATATATTAMDD